MPRAKRYTQADVIDILEKSEGRLSPVSHEPGHALGLHVNIAYLADRLRPYIQDRPQPAARPIIMHERGGIASKEDHIEIWREREPGLSKTKARKAYAEIFTEFKEEASAFLDLQQAGIVGAELLNSALGQAELKKLDIGSEQRVKIRSACGTYKKRYDSGLVFADSWNPKDLMDFSEAFMLVDALPGDHIHIQTLYPL
ncbi:hypothetical protein [Methylocaldum sp.]|uniref:hypothetical protein n=1 Tax=Methylocaldum sp. TaxID=1969727 RepID=UPI002D6D83EC|nr:hypothetical protein [Methylocaldum sp.]HYE35617.1 hypothetical protein [Methylocaldum sp.]